MSLTPEDRAMKAREARRIFNKMEYRKTAIESAQQELAALNERYEAIMAELMGDEEEGQEDA